MYQIIPEKSQLWLATHSIGMVRKVQEISAEHLGHVVFLDMGFSTDGTPRDYDYPQKIKPEEPNFNFWSRHYSVALDDMAELLAPDRIVLCEGSAAGDDPGLDEACYNRIFAGEFPGTRFVSVGSATVVERRMSDLLPVLRRIIDGTSIIRFRDRDDLMPEEIAEKCAQGVNVMFKYRNIESMLLSDDVLLRLCKTLDKSDCFDALQTARDNALSQSSGQRAIDDLKPAAQAVHHAAKTQLMLPRAGGTKHSFMRDVLAPLITTDTREYQNLKHDIFTDGSQ